MKSADSKALPARALHNSLNVRNTFNRLAVYRKNKVTALQCGNAFGIGDTNVLLLYFHTENATARKKAYFLGGFVLLTEEQLPKPGAYLHVFA